MSIIIKYIIIILIALSLTSCVLFDLDSFVLPEDDEFETLINSLDTPKKICQYMAENFAWNISILTYSPYQAYLANLEGWNDTGDCDDFATFAIWVAHYHGYEVYRIKLWCKTNWFYGLPLVMPHVLGVFVEDNWNYGDWEYDKYTYSDNNIYIPLFADNFEEIVNHYEKSQCHIKKVVSWKVCEY